MINKVSYFKPAGLNSWETFLENLYSDNTQGIFLMVAEETEFIYQMLQPLFRQYNIPIFGGIFPGVIYEDCHYTEGVVGCAIGCPMNLDIIHQLNKFTGFPTETSTSEESMLILIDGRSRNITKFLNTIFETTTCQGFIGGGAGTLHSGHEQHVLFSQNDFFNNGAIIVNFKSYIGIKVSHGWQPMYGPLVVNRSHGNKIMEINWQSAFSTYQKVLKAEANISIEQEEFFNIAKGYPFGMVKMDGSIIVRDIIHLKDDGSLVTVGEIPENSIIMLLQGSSEDLINSASNVAKHISSKYNTTGGRRMNYLLVDCISRALYLGEDLKKELQTVREHISTDSNLFGFLSFGEIASNGDRYLEFYNKTTVVGVCE
ncbi:MAG: histidine kinase [Firmicutes bacterium]|nr:histidine kinase [Bacillota bacterium]